MTLPLLGINIAGMKTKAILFLIVLVIAIGAFWAFNPNKTVDVKVIKPIHAPAVQAVYATGTVEASLMIPISPKIGARLMTLDVDEGSKVVAGQTLAQLEDADLQQNVADLQAKLDLAQKDLSRAQKLAKTGAIAKESLDQSQATYKSAAASVQRAKAEMDYLKLIAPEAGTIIRRDGEIGELIPNGTPVFWMSGGDDLRIETEVDEEDIGMVQPGQKVVISADAYPGKIFNGTVQSITPKGDPVARSYRVRVTFDEVTPLMIGMTSETNIITQEKADARMVPATSVKDGHVLKIAAGKAENVAVTVGIKTPNAVEIIDGIDDGDGIAEAYDSTLLDKGNLHGKPSDWKPSDKK